MTFIRCLILGGLVVLCTLTAGRAQQLKSPMSDVLSVAKDAQAGKDVTKTLTALKKRFGTPRAVMNIFNPRHRGGVGFGPKGRAIEQQLVDLEEEMLNADTLKNEAADLTQLAHINFIAIELTRAQAPTKPFQGRGKKEWEADLSEMKTGTESLLKAIKSSDTKGIQQAAKKINAACNRCHEGKK